MLVVIIPWSLIFKLEQQACHVFIYSQSSIQDHVSIDNVFLYLWGCFDTEENMSNLIKRIMPVANN
jgi:hypothetical protein